MSLAGGNNEMDRGLPEVEELELPSDNDLNVLRAMGGDSDAQRVSFQGIRRKLGLHQETLSRSLHRLQRDGYIERLVQGYRVSEKGRTTISLRKLGESGLVSKEDAYPVSILKAMLPEDFRPQDLVASLSNRWFGNLRWLGMGEADSVVTMSWITIDSNMKMTVKITEDALTIESFAGNSGSISLAVRSAYELFDHVTKVFKQSYPAKGQQPATHPRAA